MSCPYYTFRSNDYYCTKKGGYVNSDVYYKYCRKYDYDSCPIYKDEPSSGCYLTSACTEAKGLPDDCYELTALRAFRDRWLTAQPNGKEEISEYYRTAPAIVAAIHKRADSAAVFDRIYSELVAPCVAWIEENQMDRAHQHYKTYTLHLQEQYLNG